MPIREQGYRHWEGKYTHHAFRWWTVAKAGLRSTVYTKGRLLLLLVLIGVAWIFPFFFGVFYFFGEITSRLRPPDDFLRDNLFQMLTVWQWMWAVLFSAVVGSRLVANDLRSEALYIYLSKPMRRIDYIIGKFLACWLWLLPVTFAPAIWVFLAAAGSTNKLLHLDEPNEIFWETMLVYFVLTLLCAAAAVTISSFTKRWNLALIGWVGAAIILQIVGPITAAASRKNEWLYVAPLYDVFLLARHVWERPIDASSDPAWQGAAWILVGLIAALVGVFSIRIGRLEVSE